jgi:cell division septal protein FtsQ
MKENYRKAYFAGLLTALVGIVVIVLGFYLWLQLSKGTKLLLLILI